MNEIKQWLKKHIVIAIIIRTVLVLVLLYNFIYYFNAYYVTHKLIYRRYADTPYETVLFSNWSIEYYLDGYDGDSELAEILREYDDSKYDLAVVYGGELKSFVLWHDDVWSYDIECKNVRNPYAINYYIIPNVFFIPIEDTNYIEIK